MAAGGQHLRGVVVVGVGIAGRVRIRDLQECPCDLELKGFVSRRPLEIAGVEHMQFEDALSRTDVHAVIISTEPASHADYVQQALERGKHVLVEYPVALSSAVTHRLYQTASDMGLVLHEENIALLTDQHQELKKMAAGRQLQSASTRLVGNAIEIVETFKFLGTLILLDMKWEKNIEQLVMKAQQRLFFLRRLKSFGVSQQIMVQFYRAAIESILNFSMTVWYGSATDEARKKLNRGVKTASHIVGSDLLSLESLYHARTIKRASSIIHDEHHPAHSLFEPLPSGSRFRSIKAKTTRFQKSFYPLAVQALSNVAVV